MSNDYFIRIGKVREDQFNIAHGGIEACGLTGEDTVLAVIAKVLPVGNPVGRAARLAYAKQELVRLESKQHAVKGLIQEQREVVKRLEQLGDAS